MARLQRADEVMGVGRIGVVVVGLDKVTPEKQPSIELQITWSY